MFLRKLTVILVPLALLVLLCVLMSVLFSFSWYFGGLFIGLLLGVSLALLLPLAGATRIREPFAWLLFIPAVAVLLVLLYQYLASVGERFRCLHAGFFHPYRPRNLTGETRGAICKPFIWMPLPIPPRVISMPR